MCIINNLKSAFCSGYMIVYDLCSLKGVSVYEYLSKQSFNNCFVLYCCFVYWWGRGDKSGRERYRTGFPAAGDIIHRERHTEPTGMVYSRFFSAENCGQNV